MSLLRVSVQDSDLYHFTPFNDVSYPTLVSIICKFQAAKLHKLKPTTVSSEKISERKSGERLRVIAWNEQQVCCKDRPHFVPMQVMLSLWNYVTNNQKHLVGQGYNRIFLLFQCSLFLDRPGWSSSAHTDCYVILYRLSCSHMINSTNFVDPLHFSAICHHEFSSQDEL